MVGSCDGSSLGVSVGGCVSPNLNGDLLGFAVGSAVVAEYVVGLLVVGSRVVGSEVVGGRVSPRLNGASDGLNVVGSDVVGD